MMGLFFFFLLIAWMESIIDFGNVTFMTASTRSCKGFLPVIKCISSKQCCTIRIAINFFPLLRPCDIRELTKRSTMGHPA